MTSRPEGAHVDSEQLALLAMGAPTEPGVAEHVGACRACAQDLSLLRSLLDADGPDGSDGVAQAADSAAAEAPPAAALQADADGNDARSLPPAAPDTAAGPPPGDTSAAAAARGHNPWLVAAALLVLVAAVALLAYLLMR